MNLDAYWDKVNKTDTCWLWTASSVDGYGQWWDGEKPQKAHRVAYEALVGKVPSGLHLDHLCGVRECVNPEHLEPVTAVENNNRRKMTKYPRRPAPKNKKTYFVYIHAPEFKAEPKKSALLNKLLDAYYKNKEGK